MGIRVPTRDLSEVEGNPHIHLLTQNKFNVLMPKQTDDVTKTVKVFPVFVRNTCCCDVTPLLLIDAASMLLLKLVDDLDVRFVVLVFVGNIVNSQQSRNCFTTESN